MNISGRTLKLHEVAERMSMTVPEFQRRRGHLTHRHHFPRALPGSPAIWSEAQVNRWIDNGGQLTVEAPSSQGEPRSPLEEIIDEGRRALDARYG